MKVIRWIAVLPASILALFLVSIFLKFSMSFSGLETDSIISQCFIGFTCGVAFIYAGVYVAPSHKVKVAFSLMIIGILLSLVSLYAVNFVYFTYRDNFREVFAIIGAITTYIGVKGAKGNLNNM
tara:strand:- start:4466 stop:4837 length:372 start_codon:yes stop_codon:yes gene_type:complete